MNACVHWLASLCGESKSKNFEFAKNSVGVSKESMASKPRKNVIALDFNASKLSMEEVDQLCPRTLLAENEDLRDRLADFEEKEKEWREKEVEHLNKIDDLEREKRELEIKNDDRVEEIKATKYKKREFEIDNAKLHGIANVLVSEKEKVAFMKQMVDVVTKNNEVLLKKLDPAQGGDLEMRKSAKQSARMTSERRERSESRSRSRGRKSSRHKPSRPRYPSPPPPLQQYQPPPPPHYQTYDGYHSHHNSGDRYRPPAKGYHSNCFLNYQ